MLSSPYHSSARRRRVAPICRPPRRRAAVPEQAPGLVCWLAPAGLSALADGADVTTWHDSSGNGNDAASVPGHRPTWGAAAASVVFGGGAYLDLPLTPSGECTFLARARFTAFTGSTQVLLSCHQVGPPAGGFILAAYPSDHLLFQTGLGGTWVDGVSVLDGGPLDTVRSSVVLRVAATTTEVWLRGTRLIHDTAHGAIAPGKPLRLGANAATLGDYCHGELGEFLYYGRALTDGEIATLTTYLGA